ncbi:MAG TPA: ABC transporter substrate-binding protein [Anaerolineales bacterium]|nr:ABC transporter substrate-binding protein [Anaerolineales bacterium]
MFPKRLSLISAIVALTLLVSACGGGTATVAPTTGAQATAAPTPPPAPEATAAPKVMVLAYTTTFPDIDPSTSFSNDSAVTSNVYEPLVWYNPPGSAEVLSPGLAASWEASDDSLTWTFHLREGVKFHDGAPFNAEAVKFSIERTKRINGGAAWIWSPVNEIEIKDDYTVVFHLDYATPLDLIASSGYAAWMFSPSVGDKDSAWFNEGHDAGTGPYMIEKYEPGQRIILTRFDDYWGGWNEGQFDKAVLEVVEDPTVRQQKIDSGEADWTYQIPTENLQAVDANPDVKVVVNPAFQNLVGLFNNKKPPLDHPKVRQALSYAFPYETYLKSVLEGYATQSRGPVPTGMFGHDPTLFQYTHDLDQARPLLTEAGYPDGGFELTMTYATGDTLEEQAGELWKAELAKLGVTLNLQPLAWEAQWNLGRGDPANAQDIFVMYWWPTYVTPYDFLFNMFHSEASTLFNLGYYGNPKFDEMIDTANELSGSDKAGAERMFQEAQKMLVDDAASLFFFDQQNIHVTREDIEGYVDNPAYSHVVFIYQLSR